MTAEYIMRKGTDSPEHIEYSEWAAKYAEPGYTNPDKGIIFADWNHFNQRVLDILERKWFAVEWSDEWSTCSDCGKAIRTSPDCYHWKAYYWIRAGFIVCGDCISDNPDDYLQECANNPGMAVNTDMVNSVDAGFERMNDVAFENGFHPGQTDKPAGILGQYQAKHPDHEFVFTYESSQFYIEFNIFGRKVEDDI